MNLNLMNESEIFGWWVIGGDMGLKLAVRKKPKWLHIKMMKWLMGIDWIPGTDPQGVYYGN
jgi:hypothetical protein